MQRRWRSNLSSRAPGVCSLRAGFQASSGLQPVLGPPGRGRMLPWKLSLIDSRISCFAPGRQAGELQASAHRCALAQLGSQRQPPAQAATLPAV